MTAASGSAPVLGLTSDALSAVLEWAGGDMLARPDFPLFKEMEQEEKGGLPRRAHLCGSCGSLIIVRALRGPLVPHLRR